MIFLDRSGHTFELSSWPYEPIGYEYEENEYTFWIDSKKLDKLSVNNYYCRSIYLVIPFSDLGDSSFDDNVDVSISIDSNKFWLISTNDIQDIVDNGKSINEYFKYDLDEDHVRKTLSNDDLTILVFSESKESSVDRVDSSLLSKNPWPKESVALIPFYVICNSEDEGTWLTNILIHVSNKNDSDVIDEDWCPITVGGEFVEQNEALYINGTNLGIELPKDMFRSIWQCSFINNEFNESIYNQKLKEYLMNYMSIKGELGNYNSAIDSLKWFGYGDKITISKLLQTDNNMKVQFVRDYFNVNTDILESFKKFKNSTYISLTIKENDENGDIETQHISDDGPWGENTPVLEDLFSKNVEVRYDYNNEKFKYLKPYYDFTFYELALKLSCLKYYYKKYFLPIHLGIHSATIAHKVYANDVKMANFASNSMLVEDPISTFDKSQVVFWNSSNLFFNHQIHYVDHDFNEFSDTSNDLANQEIYYIDDTCLSVPIKFINDKQDDGDEIPTLFDCVLLLEKKNDIYDSAYPYRLTIDKKINPMKDILSIYQDLTRKELDLDSYQFAYSTDKTNWSPWIKGYENLAQWISKEYSYKIFTEEYAKSDDTINEDPQLTITADELTTKYQIHLDKLHITKNKSLSDILKNAEGFEDYDSTIDIKDQQQEFCADGYYILIPSNSEMNVNPLNRNDIYGTIICIPSIYLMMKFDNTETYDIKIDGKSCKRNSTISFLNDSVLVYESHFKFIQDNSHHYNNFVIYPKYFSGIKTSDFVSHEFTLRLLVNGKWYKYEFVAKMTDIGIEFGKLQYQYYDNEFDSKFSQLSYLGTDRIEFNSYMYEPKMVEVNDINVLENIERYILKNNIYVISSDLLSKCNSRYIIYGKMHLKILFPETYLKKDESISIKKSDITFEGLEGKFNHSIFVFNENLRFLKNVLCSVSNDEKQIWTRIYDDKQFRSEHESVFFESTISNDDSNNMTSSDNILTFRYDGSKFICEEDKTSYEVYDGYFFNDNDSMYLSKYQEEKNIISSDQFLNHIALYDIYQNSVDESLISFDSERVKIACNGVTFDNTSNNSDEVNVDIYEGEKDISRNIETIIYGTPLWDEDIYSNDVDLYSEYVNYDITQKSDEFKKDEFNDDNNGIQDEMDEAHLMDYSSSVSKENSRYYYYQYEDFTGKKYYSDQDILSISNKSILDVISTSFSPWFAKKPRGIDSLKICSIYFKKFEDIWTISDDENFEKIEWCEDNNYNQYNSKVWKSSEAEDNSKIRWNLQYTSKFGSQIIFDKNKSKIYTKTNYCRKNGDGTLPDIDESELTIDEILAIFSGNECDILIKVTLYLFVNSISTFFQNNKNGVVNGELIYVNNDQAKSFINIDDEELRNLYMNDQYIEGVSKKYVEVTNTNGDKEIVVLGYDKRTLYVNMHNNEIVYDNQPGVYIYDLSSLDQISEDDLNKINSKEDYSKYVLNIENETDEEIVNSIELLYHNDEYSKKKIMKDYEYSKDNVYVIKHITNQTGTIQIQLGLHFYQEDQNGYYTKEEMKNMTSLIILKREKDENGKYVAKEPSIELKYNHAPIEITITSNDIIDIVFKISITDDKNLKYRASKRTKIPKIGIFPIIKKKTNVKERLRYYPTKNDSLTSDWFYEDLNSNFEKNENQDKDLISLYNQFFENNYIVFNQKTNTYEKIDDTVLKVDYVYNIEKQYSIWSQSNTIVESQVDDEDSIKVAIEDDKHDPKWYAIKNKKYSELNEKEQIELYNYSRYLYSIENEVDFYECKSWHGGKLLEFNDYVFDTSYYKFISPKVNLNRYLDYDFYLMHDDKYWYGIFISKDTIDKLDTKLNMKIEDDQKILEDSVENEFYYNHTGYELRYVNENVDFLINRMRFMSTEGKNHFNVDDLIAANVYTNDNLPTDIMQGSRWSIKPMSLGMTKSQTFESNSEMTIIPYPEGYSNYIKGYYDISLRYSLDGQTQNQYKKKARLRIG